MAKIFPSLQSFIDTRDGNQYFVTKIKILSSTSDHVELPPFADIAFLHTALTTSDPAFYVTGNHSTQLNIDSATVGTEYVVVTRHNTFINFGPDDVG